MHFLGLTRSAMLSRRFVAPNIHPLVRSKSTATKSVLFSPSPRKLEVAVTPKRVTLTFSESLGKNLGIPTVPATKVAPTTKGLKDSIDAKIKKGLDAMGAKATKTITVKAPQPVEKVEAFRAVKAPKAAKSSKKTSSGSVKSTEAVPCWVDASSTHIAIVIGDQYKVFALNNGWMTKARDVNWAETAAFELLAQILSQQGRTGVVHVNSDSAAALRAMSGERVKVPEIMESARRTNDILKTSMFTIKGVKVSRTTNLADRFTRGKTVDGYEEMKGDMIVPKALVPFVTAV